jgi:hypothetical protein
VINARRQDKSGKSLALKYQTRLKVTDMYKDSSLVFVRARSQNESGKSLAHKY